MDAQINLDELERLAKAATPQNIDAAEIIEGDEGKTIECPVCCGEGHVSLEGDYCNFDECAIGVQFYGIGNEHGAAERFYRAANPAVVIELVRRLRASEKTLQGMGYTYHGGELWKPPLGAAPKATAEPVNARLLEFAQEWLARQGTDENYMTAKARDAIAAAESLKSEG